VDKDYQQLTCSICGNDLFDPSFASNYPNFVCHDCGSRAVNIGCKTPEWNSQHDSGENPVFIDGKKCWRRYRYGGYITMLDDMDCSDIGEFYEKHGWIG
jgi:DNA-directed RNA polymerase subunit RPC12/RpoP